MASNIEIKARVRDVASFIARVQPIADSGPTEIAQEDVFFPSQSGRLKLRVLSPGLGELIFYHRDNSEGPKFSEYHIARTADPAALRELLTRALGLRGVVRKRRRLWLIGQTRIHLDAVEGLGDFMELEVVLQENQNPEEGVRIAEELMARLAIEPNDLIECAYIDLMERSARKIFGA